MPAPAAFGLAQRRQRQTWHPNSHSGMYLEAAWSIASHPATPERLFAGTDMGAFRWDEPTARWVHLPSPMQDVWSIAVDPADPDALIAGTRPAGFWRSTDAGQSWSPLAAPGISQFSDVNVGPTRVSQILFDPVDDGRSGHRRDRRRHAAKIAA
jgi:hypothetical protein